MQCFLIILPYGSMYDVNDTDHYDILSRVPIYMLSSVLVYKISPSSLRTFKIFKKILLITMEFKF